MITIIANFDVTNTDEFKKLATEVMRETRKEKGNLSYKVYQDRHNSARFTFIEEWLNDAAIEQHNNAKHFTRFIDAVKPVTNGDPEITQLNKIPSVYC